MFGFFLSWKLAESIPDMTGVKVGREVAGTKTEFREIIRKNLDSNILNI